MVYFSEAYVLYLNMPEKINQYSQSQARDPLVWLRLWVAKVGVAANPSQLIAWCLYGFFQKNLHETNCRKSESPDIISAILDTKEMLSFFSIKWSLNKYDPPQGENVPFSEQWKLIWDKTITHRFNYNMKRTYKIYHCYNQTVPASSLQHQTFRNVNHLGELSAPYYRYPHTHSLVHTFCVLHAK